ELKGVFKIGFVEDPWGTRIEVVQDPELLGLHHVHMRGPNPDEIFTWLLAKYGGERAEMKGRIDGIKYSLPGFSTVWILAEQGDAEPSENHEIDHIGWRSARTLTKTIDGLRAQGVTVLTEPCPLPLANGPTINFAYVAGPAGAKIEMVDRPGLKPGEQLSSTALSPDCQAPSCLQNSRRGNPVRSSVSGVVTPSVSFMAAPCPTIC